MNIGHLLVLGVLSVNIVHAASLTVPSGYKTVARTYSIPPKIFFAIALTESRKRIYGKKVMPWPWTLNVEGRGYRYKNRKQAWVALTKFLTQNKIVDIGLMQVNWRYHGEKLKTPWLALDPYHNMRVSAKILSRCYKNKGNWWVCVGRYHSPGPKESQIARAESYRQRVKEQYKRIS